MVPPTVDTRHLDRLPADDLHKVTAEHVWNAVQSLSTEAVPHAFGESREFDLRGKVAFIIHTERLLTILSLADIALAHSSSRSSWP